MRQGLKLWAYVLALTILVLYFGGIVGGRQGFLVAFIFSMSINILAYSFSDSLLLWTYNAVPLEGSDPWGVRKITNALCEKLEMPKPKLFLIPSQTPNAFSAGKTIRNSTIAITEGLVKVLTRDELEAVIAHELKHIQTRDTAMMSISAALGAMILNVGLFFKWLSMMGHSKNDTPSGNVVGTLFMAIFAPLSAALIRIANNKNREFNADQGAVELTGKAQALATALWKIHNYGLSQPLDSTLATAHVFTVTPITKEGFGWMFSIHPPVQDRILRLIGRKL